MRLIVGILGLGCPGFMCFFLGGGLIEFGMLGLGVFKAECFQGLCS